MKNCHYCVHVRHRPLGKRPIMECAIKDSLVINCPDFEEEPGMYYPIPLKSLDLVELWAHKSDVLAILGEKKFERKIPVYEHPLHPPEIKLVANERKGQRRIDIRCRRGILDRRKYPETGVHLPNRWHSGRRSGSERRGEG